MDVDFSLVILRLLAFTSVFQNVLLIAALIDDPNTFCSSLEPDDCGKKNVYCPGITQGVKLGELSEEVTLIKFQYGVHCDSETKTLLQLARQRGITINGKCASPPCVAGRRICELKDDFNCDNKHIRRRRSVDVSEESNATSAKPSGPGGIPVLPCDFDQDFCQWYQLSDSDFQWKRNKGNTPSFDTGPSADHTTGKGYYIYIETSLPRRLNDKARLVGPTLRPLGSNQTCKMTFYLHMYGDHIGKLNIYQAPVIGHNIVKKAFTSSQGNAWKQQQVTFDSDREFQVIFEGVRGVSFKGDIAMDDISFSPGCQRLEPAYVRFSSSNTSEFGSGVVEVYSNGSWGDVCYGGWNDYDSAIACKELGFLSAGNFSGVPMGGPSKTGFRVISCRGSESSIQYCSKGALTYNITCPSNQTVSLECRGIAPVCPLKTHFYCPKNSSVPAKCISVAQRCDFVDDCWDGSDEKNCGNYTRCTFEDVDICGWLQARNDHMNWTRMRGNAQPIFTGPNKDHNGDATKYFIYSNVGQRSGYEKAIIAAIPRFQGNHEGLCKVRFFYHMNGWATGALRVLVSDIYDTRTVWEKRGSKGNLWHRAEVTLLNTSRSFQVMFEAEHNHLFFFGDIAIDDVSFTPECRPALPENITCKSGTFKCRSGECIALERVCDFSLDCFDGFDELNCGFEKPGRCNFEQNFCDWVNDTDDRFDFERKSGRTMSYGTGPSYDHTLGYGRQGSYIYIEASSPRKYGDKARLAGPQFMWKGIVGCKIRFSYHMWSDYRIQNVGTLKVLLRNVITGETKTLWQRSGSQGNKWLLASVPIATNWSVAQIVLEATRGHSFQSDIAIDDISFSPPCYPSIPIHVDKNYDVRLVSLKSSYEGRVEVFRVGAWGTVCNDGWDNQAARVVCRQLGYAGTTGKFPNTAPGTGPIWLDNLKCFGNESNLSMCSHNGWSVHNCDHSKDATASCDISGGTTIPLRLSGHPSDKYKGVVEVFYQGVWGTVCHDEWDLHDAHVACRQAGFLGVQGVTKEMKSSSNKVWLSKVGCQGNENSLGKCNHPGWGAVGRCANGHAGVICKQQSASEGDIRLKGGRSPKEGRVEIFHRGEWGTVCEDKWNRHDAEVVCFEFGFTSVVSYYQSFGPGTGRIWLNNVECTGTEQSLVACPRSAWGINQCTHHEDVGVICGDQTFIGCYKDNHPRVMPHRKSMSDLTPVKCLRYCRSKGYSFIGLSWSTDCYCGNHYNKYGNASSLDCSSPCVGDPSKICGGPWALSVYATNPAIIPSLAPGYLAVRQSCSSVTYQGSYAILNPISSPNYFSGNHSSGYIWSPQFPANYPNKIHCVWVLNLLPGSKAKVTFEAFDLEESYDSFEARDGKRKYDTLLTPRYGFSGKKSSPLTATSNIMWLKFYADQTITSRGFKLNYKASGLLPQTTPSPGFTTIDPTLHPLLQKVFGGCNGALHKENVTFGYFDQQRDAGYVQSPKFPNQYEANPECEWTILVQSDFKISIVVSTLDLLAGDYLKLTDGHKNESSRGRALPWTFQSRDRFVKVSFDSDLSSSRRKRSTAKIGFYLKYERVVTYPKTTIETFQPTTVRTTIQAKTGNHDKSYRGKVDDGAIIGIVLGCIVAILIIILILVLFKNKKSRNNQGARHCFLNQAYDNTDGMAMSTTAAGSPHVPQDPNIFYANVAVAPPPYTPQADSTEPAPVYATPSAQGNDYAHLYSHPPSYRQSTGNPNTSTTSIGSVTSLQEAVPGNNRLLPLDQPKRVDNLPPVEVEAGGVADLRFAKTPLPAIGAAQATGDQAGPLPEKVPLDIAATDNNNTEPCGPRPPGPLEGNVTRSHASQQFDVEVPFEFICPISNDIMKHPVSASDGYTYERQAIKSWFRRNQTSPMTNEKLTDMNLRPNENLEARIKEFMESHSIV